jgi:hypothetical protein
MSYERRSDAVSEVAEVMFCVVLESHRHPVRSKQASRAGPMKTCPEDRHTNTS